MFPVKAWKERENSTAPVSTSTATAEVEAAAAAAAVLLAQLAQCVNAEARRTER